jgi:hypothetical protein
VFLHFYVATGLDGLRQLGSSADNSDGPRMDLQETSGTLKPSLLHLTTNAPISRIARPVTLICWLARLTRQVSRNSRTHKLNKPIALNHERVDAAVAWMAPATHRERANSASASYRRAEHELGKFAENDRMRSWSTDDSVGAPASSSISRTATRVCTGAHGTSPFSVYRAKPSRGADVSDIPIWFRKAAGESSWREQSPDSLENYDSACCTKR